MGWGGSAMVVLGLRMARDDEKRNSRRDQGGARQCVQEQRSSSWRESRRSRARGRR